jgi:hypothetical protein
LWADVTSDAGARGDKPRDLSCGEPSDVVAFDGTGLVAVTVAGWVGEWRSLVARTVRDREVAGSSPASPTTVGAESTSPPDA